MNFVLFAVMSYISFFSFIDAQIYCLDAYECEGRELMDGTVSCEGFYGCVYSTIDSSTLYARGCFGARDSEIDSTNLFSPGYQSIYGSTISAHHVEASGQMTGYFAVIKADDVHSYGYESLAYADISPLSDTLDVYFYGYYSGTNSLVTCHHGNTCNIYCGKSGGCHNAELYCFSGSDCKYDCDDDPDNCPVQNGGVKDKKSKHYLSDAKIQAKYDIHLARNKRSEKRVREVFDKYRMRGMSGERAQKTHDFQDGSVANHQVADDQFMAMDDNAVDIGDGYHGTKPQPRSNENSGRDGFGVVIAVGLVTTFIGMVIGYRCGVKRSKYSEITQLLN